MVSHSALDPVEEVSNSFPSLDLERLRFAYIVVLVVPRVLQTACLSEPQRLFLSAEISKRLKLPVPATDALLRFGSHPSNRADLSPRDLKTRIDRLRFRAEELLVLPPEANMLEKSGISKTLCLTEILLSLIQRTDTESEKHRQLLRVFRLAKDVGLDPILITAMFRKWGFVGGDHAQKEVALESGRRLMIGSHEACDINFFDPLVEPLHASLSEEQGSWVVRAETSHRPLWCNEQIVDRAAFPDGARLRIGPYGVLRDGDSLKLSEDRKLSALSAISLQRKIGDISLLDDISFTVFTGEVIALIGPSGAGKTTLLNAINGVAPADSGQVLFNGRSFHDMLSKDKSLIGIVPQDDLVLPELTVEESLYYSGRLRLPSSSSKSDIMKQVERVLSELDIAHIRHQRIGDALRRGISGGQRKRVNLGQELISQSTQILFLDEPTSGLDPRASQDIVRLVRNLSDSGRIVFLVTHDLTDQIIGLVDDLLVLVKGGRLAYFGEQADALRYFGVESTDKIFQKFDAEQGRWAERYRVEPNYGMREIAINEFDVAEKEALEPPKIDNWFSGFWRQFMALTSRYSKVKLRDRTGMLVMMLQPPFLALVMTIVFRHYPEGEPSIAVPSHSMIYMMSLSCLWFGMSASVRELISDQVVFRRERRVGVGVMPYVLSKFFILALLTAIQCFFLVGVMHHIFNMGEYGFSLSGLTLVACLTSWVGMSLGLLIGSIWRSSEAAVGTLPLILIPQIALSSIMYSIRDMGEFAQACTWGIFQRYTFDAFLKTGEEVAVRNYRGEFDPQAVKGTLWKLGLKLSDKVEDIGLTLTQLHQIMIAFILGMLGLTLIRVYYRDRNAS